MQKNQNSTSRVIKSHAFIDFIPAELRVNKDWLIVYYAKNPVNGKLERQRLRVPSIKSKTERLRHAKKIVLEINRKLAEDWSPFMEESGKNFRSFIDLVGDFRKHVEKLYQDGIYRDDTKRSYNSNCNLLELFVSTKNHIRFGIEINRAFCSKYLDWIYTFRESSPRTRNNHLIFIKLFCSYLVDKGVLAENPTFSIKPMKLPSKVRIVFDTAIKLKISKYVNGLGSGFNVACQTLYFCFIRNSELRKLKVCMIDIKQGIINVPKEISKNRKDCSVTIPNQFLEVLANHIKVSNPSDYVFSSNNFYAGKIQMPVRKIANVWDKLRIDLDLDNKYQFYSYKDTGITDLLNDGVPALKVRDQARHGDLRVTEIYTQRTNIAEETIKKSNLSF